MADRRLTLEECKSVGFTNAAYIDPQKLELLPEVRDMCAVNSCGRYDKSWACPPACGSLEEQSKRLRGFSYGVLLQVTEQMEDDFDVEAMERAERLCKEGLHKLSDQMEGRFTKKLLLGAGTCTVCETCTYPDAPCRFPDKAFASLEACGLVVSKECERAGIPYYYGPKTITFTGAVLVTD